MCIVVFIASRSPLPLIPFREDAPAFTVTELTDHERPVLNHLALPHIRHAGSHTSCGCGFNEGREHPDLTDATASSAGSGQLADKANSLESSARLARYVREHRVELIYSCWSGDEGEPQESERRLAPEDLVAEDFFFRERERLIIDHDAAESGT